jgi:hypothetical protein
MGEALISAIGVLDGEARSAFGPVAMRTKRCESSVTGYWGRELDGCLK